MTHLNLRTGLLTLAAMTLTFPSASAMAADVNAPAASTFIVKSAADANIRRAAKAHKKGEFEDSIRINHRALKTSLSSKRAAIVHSNLCATYATVGEMNKAQAACSAALELRPDYAPAVANKTALTVKLAQK